MTEQQQHLQQVLDQQQQLAQEFEELQKQISAKKELFTKLQGISEYLQQTGVTLPTKDEEEVTTSEVEVQTAE
jgi:hypothetical protein